MESGRGYFGKIHDINYYNNCLDAGCGAAGPMQFWIFSDGIKSKYLCANDYNILKVNIDRKETRHFIQKSKL